MLNIVLFLFYDVNSPAFKVLSQGIYACIETKACYKFADEYRTYCQFE